MCMHSLVAHMPDDESVNIRIKRDTWEQLHSEKGPGDSFDDVISRLLEERDPEGNPNPRMTAD